MIDAAGTVLAHQGGWDEILFVLTPLVVFAGLLALARKRADEAEGQVSRLQREVESLQSEIARLGSEVGRLTDERAVVNGVVERGISEIARVAGEVLTALKER